MEGRGRDKGRRTGEGQTDGVWRGGGRTVMGGQGGADIEGLEGRGTDRATGGTSTVQLIHDGYWWRSDMSRSCGGQRTLCFTGAHKCQSVHC